MNFKKYVKETTKENLVFEAKFNINNMRKVSDLLARIASKKLGAKFQYAWGDNFKKSSGAKGSGARYMSTEGVQIRFNHVVSKNTFTINSVDYWKKGDSLTEPSLTIYLAEDVNIVKIKNQIFEAIQTKKVPKIKLKDIVNESVFQEISDINESPKDTRAEFLELKGVPTSYAVSVKNFKKQLEKRGLEAEWDQYMQINENDSEKTEFNEKIKQDEKQLGPSGVYADPNFVFEDMKQAAMTIAKGKWRSLIIAGMGGIGKSFGVKQTLTSMLGPFDEGPNGKWMYYEGMKASPLGLYLIFLLNKDKLVVFDDSDSIWQNEVTINMMKIATADDGDRTLSWVSPKTANVALMTKEEREAYEEEFRLAMMEDPNTTMKPPSSFNFKGSVINISNRPADKFDKAIKSRAIFIDLYLAERDVVRRMYTIKQMQGLEHDRILRLLKALVPDAEDALAGKGRYAGEVKYITPEDARKKKTLNMRSLNIVEALEDSGVPDWERMGALYA